MATKGDKRGVVIHTVEMHTGGEPLRIIQSGRQYRGFKQYEWKKDIMEMWHVFSFNPSLSFCRLPSYWTCGRFNSEIKKQTCLI